MVWGGRENRLAQQYRKGNLRKLPEKVLGAPSLRPGLELYWLAYAELSTCRPPSFGDLLPIPWTAIDAYATRYDFDEDQFDWLVCASREMDKAMAAYYKNMG